MVSWDAIEQLNGSTLGGGQVVVLGQGRWEYYDDQKKVL
jgi:hypothetical protein